MCIKKGWWDIGIIQIRMGLGAVVTTIAESGIGSKNKIFLCIILQVLALYFIIEVQKVFSIP